jgi:hypothetical protein
MYAFMSNWTVKFEYDYLGLGNRTFFIPATAPILPNDTFSSGNRNVQMVKVGFNYLFNWGAPRKILIADSRLTSARSQRLRFSHRSPFYFASGDLAHFGERDLLRAVGHAR